MKVGIIGTRGIPNAYGGFEQFTEYLSLGLVKKGVEVWVYNSNKHPYQESSWNGVHLIHRYDPEDTLGTAGQFIYDLQCILDSRKRNFDIILQLGYTSSSVWHRLLPRQAGIITNMDGLEWKRSKYSKAVRSFLKYAENLAVQSSDILIADSEVIQQYIQQQHGKPSLFIPYGAEVLQHADSQQLSSFNIHPYSYFLLIARMQPDNHVEEIIQGVLQSGSAFPLLLIGNIQNRYGKYLYQQYHSERIRFLGSLFDQQLLQHLRCFSYLYFHGHSAGGTNPSLLEAMAASALICAHDNPFNRSVLLNNAFYFSDPHDIAEIIHASPGIEQRHQPTEQNIQRIQQVYNWDKVIDAYYQAFKKLVNKN